MDLQQELLKRVVQEAVVLADEPELDVVELQLPRDLFIKLLQQAREGEHHEG